MAQLIGPGENPSFEAPYPGPTDPAFLMSGMVWNPMTQTWERASAGSGGGGLPLPSRQTVPNVGGLPGATVPSFGQHEWSQLLTQLPWKQILKIGIPAGLGLLARPHSGESGGNPMPSLPPELQRLLELSFQRMASQEPLFHAVTRQAYGGLPDYAKQGGG